MSQLVLQNLTKRFRDIPAVQDLWLEIRSGEIVSVFGPSGCGKNKLPHNTREHYAREHHAKEHHNLQRTIAP